MPSRSFLLLLLLLPALSWAAQLPGIRLYERGNYARASRSLKTTLEDPKRAPEEKALARVYLAASLLALDKAAEAQKQLEELARTWPAQKVDPVLFSPELVEMDRAIRGQMEAERLRKEAEALERERLAAAEALEREKLAAAERRQREQAAQSRPASVSAVREAPAQPQAGSSFRLRPEVVGFGDVSGLLLPGVNAGPPVFGAAAGLTSGRGWVEGSARALLGNNLGVELEAGLVFGTGVFAPRVALKGSLLPDVAGKQVFGGGGVVGARLALSSRFTALVDVSGQVFAAPDGYRSLALLGSVGLGFNLL